MANSCIDRRLIRAGWRLLPAGVLLLAASALPAQGVSPRLRGAPSQAPNPGPNQGPNQGSSAAAVPVPQPQPTPPPVSQPVSLLQQPAQPAQVTLTAARLSIHADNSSLSAILHEISNISGMKIDGLGSDERVFGTFGPGAPRDVIADLLNGTSYNVVLLGDLSNGAPRELTLTPASHGAAAPAAATSVNNEENEAEPEPPPQPEPAPQAEQPVNPQQPPGAVRTPQQLFEQLQRMRQNQAQQPSDQQQQQQTQTPPQQQ
jgi:hypothetical protein